MVLAVVVVTVILMVAAVLGVFLWALTVNDDDAPGSIYD
jgi:hypothetical protein